MATTTNQIDLLNYLYLIIFLIYVSSRNFKNKIFFKIAVFQFATLITYIAISNYNLEQNFT